MQYQCSLVDMYSANVVCWTCAVPMSETETMPLQLGRNIKTVHSSKTVLPMHIANHTVTESSKCHNILGSHSSG